MATVKHYTKKDGTKAWQFQVYLGKDETTGKEIRTTRRGFRTQAEAKKEMNVLIVDYQQNGHRKKEKILFQDIFNEWFEQYKKTVKGSTAHATMKLFDNYALPSFNGLCIGRITPKYCQKEINKWSKSISVYNLIASYVSRVFEYAIRHGCLNDNPMKKVIKPRTTHKEEMKIKENYYTKEELQQFLEYTKKLKEQYYPLFRLLAFSGMRIGEALALVWNDIDFENRSIKVTKTVTINENGKTTIGTTKTKASKRIIEIDQKTLQVLANWKMQQIDIITKLNLISVGDTKQLLFPNQKNKPSNASVVRMALIKITDDNNFKAISLHGFRHTHCSLLFEAGSTIKEVQTRLGHDDVKTTLNIYAHITKNQKQETVNKFIKLVDF